MTQPLRIAIAGLGTVGTSTVALLESERALIAARAGREVRIVAVSARDAGKERSISIANYRFETDPIKLATAADVDVVVELVGGAEGAARTLVETALINKKHVVTANKALIATHGAALAEFAAKNKVSLMFEASVAGGIPILKLLREGLAANRITRVMGILNGTCNYILSGMWEEKRELADMLAEAQAMGYAEADPSFDIDGTDTAHKLAILTALAFGTKPNLASLHIEGIYGISLNDMQFADELGYAIRLLGVSQEGSQKVYPALVAKDSPLASVRSVFNAVQVETDSAGTLFIQGKGAGGAPTASAVVADIMDIARGNASHPFGTCHPALVAGPGTTPADMSEYYIRLSVIDKPGVLADITGTFRDSGISLKSFIQHGQAAGEKVTLVIATHEANETDITQALATLGKQASILETPVCMRIEA